MVLMRQYPAEDSSKKNPNYSHLQNVTTCLENTAGVITKASNVNTDLNV